MPSAVSGRPTSPAPTTSPASAARPWPACIANIEEPICRAIPISGPIIAVRSTGMSAGSIARSSSGRPPARSSELGSIDDIEDCTCSAIGVMISCQAGRVAVSHSDRLQARDPAPVVGNDVTGSSHRSARRTASATERLWASATTGSPAEAMALRATSVAADQFTGPESGAADMPWSMAPSCDRAAPRLPMSNGFVGWPPLGSESSGGSGGVKPKGTLLMPVVPPVAGRWFALAQG